MANKVNELRNPYSNDVKTNQRRRRSMLLLHALGLESFLNTRLKKVLDVCFPSKEQTFNEDALQSQTLDTSSEQASEIALLSKLLDFLHAATMKFVNNVKSALQNNIVQAQQAGTLSTAAASNLSSAVNTTFTPVLVKQAMNLQNQSQEKAKATIDNEVKSLEHQESRDVIHEIRKRASADKKAPQERHSEYRRNLIDDMELLGAISIIQAVQRSTQPYPNRDQLLHEIREFIRNPSYYSQPFHTCRTEFNNDIQFAFSSLNTDYRLLRSLSVTSSNTFKAYFNAKETQREYDPVSFDF